MKRTILFSLTILIAALFIAGCCDCRKRSKLEKPLVGTTWQLVQIMARDITPENDCYTLQLRSNGMATGKGDCNVFTATYRTTSSRELTLSNIGSTRKLCPDFETENAFFDLLETVTHYEMDADIMLLLSNGTLVGMMKAMPEDTNLDYLPL